MEPGHFDLLVVEDNPGDVELLQEYLLDAHHHWHVTVAGRLSEAIELLERDRDGVILGAVTDITEKKALKRQLMHAQKLEAVGRLAGGVAHDFNNLLTAVRGNCELIIEELSPSDTRRDLLHEIRDAASRATALTRQLLIFSRRDTIQPGKVDLHAAIEAMEQLLGRLLSEDIRITRDLDAGVPWTIGDPSRLEQMVMNLVLNAGDAMPEGGELWIQTTDDPARAREWDPEIESRIYDPFFSTKDPHEGTGLGLSTVYGIVTEADGRISAGESPMGGAQFTIRLPRTEGKDLQEEGGGATSVGGGGERIFLLEDEDSVRSVVRRILEKGGYEVVDVGDPAEAVSRFREAGEVDLLLSDIIMPGRHGPEIYEELTKLDPDLKALFISGYSEEATVQKVGELEATVIPKPFSPTTLLEAVARILAG